MRSLYDGRWFCSERPWYELQRRDKIRNLCAYRDNYIRFGSTSRRRPPKIVDYQSTLPKRPKCPQVRHTAQVGIRKHRPRLGHSYWGQVCTTHRRPSATWEKRRTEAKTADYNRADDAR